MANNEHLGLLRNGGVTAWNKWRRENPGISPILSDANLGDANLSGANLSGANLSGANLQEADLGGAVLSRADLSRAMLIEAELGLANLSDANLSGANLFSAYLRRATLREANLSGAKLSGADLRKADLGEANLRGTDIGYANLSRANLWKVDLSGANLRGVAFRGATLREANLSGANLRGAVLVDTDLTGADLTGCRIYGISAWGLKLEGATQQNLIITRPKEPEITVDNIEVAQFVYLLLHNEKIRDVIDTIGRKGVLLLGRFTEGRITILERLRDKLRSLGYVPMVFNFDKPETKDFIEKVLFRAEERFGLVLPDNNIGPSSTVNDIVDLIVARLREQEAPGENAPELGRLRAC